MLVEVNIDIILQMFLVRHLCIIILSQSTRFTFVRFQTSKNHAYIQSIIHAVVYVLQQQIKITPLSLRIFWIIEKQEQS